MLGDDELSNGERRRLAEIESSLRADDLEFVRRFEQRQLRRRHNPRAAVALLAISVAVIVIVVALAQGNVGAAVVGLIPVGGGVALWVTRCDT
jgi:Flp pilus assembly protein TadB